MRIIDADGKQSVSWAPHAAGAACVAMALGVYYCFVYQGMTLAESIDSQRIDQLSLLLSESAAIQRTNNDLHKELGVLDVSIAAIRKRLPHELRQEEFTADLSRVAEQAGLRLDDLQWGVPQVWPTYAQAEVQVNCSGSFASMCRFLDAVSQLARITDIAQLQLAGDAESANHTFHVSFILYYGADPRESDNNEGVL